jgi:hypothetical protein
VSAAEEDSLVSFAALRRLVVETVEMREKTPDKGREVGALLVAAELVVWLLEERVVTVLSSRRERVWAVWWERRVSDGGGGLGWRQHPALLMWCAMIESATRRLSLLMPAFGQVSSKIIACARFVPNVYVKT